MIDLGLDTITDDQLVELARAIATEIAKRNPAVADAAQAAIRDEIATARASHDNLWARKKWLAKMVTDHVGVNCELTVWRAQDRDVTRVYLDLRGTDRRGRANIKWCLHVTGDSKNPPGSLTCDEGSHATKPVADSIVKIICQHAIQSFATVRIDCDQASATGYEIPPQPDDLTRRLAEIAAKRAAKTARNAYYRQVHDAAWAEHNAAQAAAMAEHGKKSPSQLPPAANLALEPLAAAARDAVNAAMAAYDAEHGGR